MATHRVVPLGAEIWIASRHRHSQIETCLCGKLHHLCPAGRQTEFADDVKIQVAMFEAHSDLEIFRIRLGKALDYEFHEDYIGGYFSEKGPRDVSSDFGVRLSC